MKKASTAIEWVNNFNPSVFLTANDEAFYVPIYEDILEEVREDILNTEDPKLCYYIKGQKGTGKTTALSFLPDENLQKKYHVINMISSEHLEIMDVHITHLLIEICNKLITTAQENGNGSVEQKFNEELKRLQGIYEKRIREDIERENKREATGSLNVDIEVKIPKAFEMLSRIIEVFPFISGGGKASGSLKANQYYRKLVKETFETRPQDLLDLLNRMLLEYKKAICPEKEILLIVNELDHMRETDTIRDLFLTHRHFIQEINCKKIFSIPVVLQSEVAYRPDHIKTFCLKISSENPLLGKRNSQIPVETLRIFQDIVAKRADKNMYSEALIQKAVLASGGIIRQFIEIMYQAGKRARRAKTDSISEGDIDYGITEVSKPFQEKVVFNNFLPVLQHIQKKHLPNAQNDNTFSDCLLNNLVIFYQNSPSAWYDVNPLVKDTVELYAKTLQLD